MAGLRVHTVMPAELVARIDASLSDGVSRGEFVRRAVEQALVTEAGGGSPGVSKASLPAPAEQPEEDAERKGFENLTGVPRRAGPDVAAFRRATQR